MSSALHRGVSLTPPMVATYARFSTDLQRDASIADQNRICAAERERQGWHAGPAFSDRALSGSLTSRPGYQSLLDGVRRRAFDVIMAEALERLSRDPEDLAALYKRCQFAGIRIFTLAEGWINVSGAPRPRCVGLPDEAGRRLAQAAALSPGVVG